ncbi:AarF/ABC1/UbiB kinase family protein [Leptospira langatensis]|uniref:AarF/ABC1/UbiB kinase family protein n=1 Tax=Leptospira langatensis TaxID=2484983 RepID=A0A5F1ZU95_9LEPT|nr:AarF/UbiB family protein [Leptospira langatensis]TGJ98884.1 AarF/ABC1/UbiB kinase family protein [Leptospira langatensis]TGL40549.1 AarF/ABC1/UbiB kinase family protein [Leptospira langatensis]
MSKSSPSTGNQLPKYSARGRYYRGSFFLWKKIFGLFWYYKFVRFFLSSKTREERENEFFRNLGLECRDFFLKMGGVYVKLGQYLASLSHLFPESFTDPLQDLQDRVPAHPFVEIKERFKKEFGKEIAEVFPDISEEPLASASIAQVHSATYKGEKVAVKILYPGIEEVISKDLKAVRKFLKRINRYLVSFDFKVVHKEIAKLVGRETDLRLEAESMDRMARYFAEEPDYVFPKTFPEWSGKSVLTAQFIEGIRITQAAALKKGQAKSRPVDLLIRAYILMVFEYRFYHADPHPGNMIYTPDEKLCFIDFGAVGEIPPSQSVALRKIVLCAMAKDYPAVLEALDELGLISKKADKDKLEEVIRYSLEKLSRFLSDTESFKNIKFEQIHTPEDLKFLKEINSSLRGLLRMVQLPTSLIPLERVLGLLVGITATLDPYRTVLDYGEKPFKGLVFQGENQWQKVLLQEGGIWGQAVSLPGELLQAVKNLNRGKQAYKLPDLENHTKRMYALGHQIISTSFILFGIHYGTDRLDKGIEPHAMIGFGVSIFFGILLALSVIKNKFSSKRNRQ